MTKVYQFQTQLLTKKRHIRSGSANLVFSSENSFTRWARDETYSAMNDERFIAIEMKISHQDRLLEELHEVIYKQQETIDKLEKKLKQIEDMASADNEIRPANEKPPHY